ncbi:unnamed protein product [Schistosoma margrebowiei]|uniref:Uncharacterized protein n=1 Tax=Schistosoma margrebowiei TaxID=48269 RepID=A0AA84ZAI5_9TREM|nr:unnamed protein product [Schistosoma margrebowiei]
MTVPSPYDGNPQTQFDFEEEYDELNAQLDALSKCLDILEAKGKKVCDEAKRLIIEYRSQNYETSS